ncbi:hypothetical protein BDW66DRAFT_125994 [Aspergillus desertorum]
MTILQCLILPPNPLLASPSSVPQDMQPALSNHFDSSLTLNTHLSLFCPLIPYYSYCLCPYALQAGIFFPVSFPVILGSTLRQCFERERPLCH